MNVYKVIDGQDADNLDKSSTNGQIQIGLFSDHILYLCTSAVQPVTCDSGSKLYIHCVKPYQ